MIIRFQKRHFDRSSSHHQGLQAVHHASGRDEHPVQSNLWFRSDRIKKPNPNIYLGLNRYMKSNPTLRLDPNPYGIKSNLLFFLSTLRQARVDPIFWSTSELLEVPHDPLSDPTSSQQPVSQSSRTVLRSAKSEFSNPNQKARTHVIDKID